MVWGRNRNSVFDFLTELVMVRPTYIDSRIASFVLPRFTFRPCKV